MNKRGPSYLHSAYLKRWPLLVNIGGAGSGPHEATIDCKEDWSFFWSSIADNTNGYDIVPANADGTTVPTFDLATGAGSIALGIAAEDLNIRMSGLSWSGGTIDAGVMWMYWDRTSATNQAGSPTTSSPKSSNQAIVQPSRDARIISYSPDSVPGPWRKDTDESIRLWFDVTDLMVERVHAYQGVRAGGGVEAIFFEVTNNGTADASMKSATSHKYVVTGEGRHLIGCLVAGGTHGNNYLAELHLTLTDGRVLKMVAEVDVTDRVEST